MTEPSSPDIVERLWTLVRHGRDQGMKMNDVEDAAREIERLRRSSAGTAEATKLRCEMCAGSKWKDACPECDGTGWYTPDPPDVAQPSADRAACEKIANEEFDRQIKIIADATDDKALSDTGRANIHAVADACALTAQRIASRIRALAVTSTNRSTQGE